jgi:hypothetical protein
MSSRFWLPIQGENPQFFVLYAVIRHFTGALEEAGELPAYRVPPENPDFMPYLSDGVIT